MKSNFKFYALIWAILVATWCAVVFLARPLIPAFSTYDLFDTHFWVAGGFILVTFIGNLICALISFKSENLNKQFLNLPLLTITRTALIVMLVVGSGLMLLPFFPWWLTAIICLIILAFNAIAVVKAAWAANAVNTIDEKVRTQTSYIRNLTVDADSILARARSEASRAECRKVYEAVRYSDPMSHPDLSVIEARITVKMDEFASAVITDNTQTIKLLADEIVILLGDRNKRCRMLK